uniref:Uncharacterized protein n=1 Tax=Meloidogyne floridensis TaxID=298350 RepID=A0A915NI66_9BILA
MIEKWRSKNLLDYLFYRKVKISDKLVEQCWRECLNEFLKGLIYIELSVNKFKIKPEEGVEQFKNKKELQNKFIDCIENKLKNKGENKKIKFNEFHAENLINIINEGDVEAKLLIKLIERAEDTTTNQPTLLTTIINRFCLPNEISVECTKPSCEPTCHTVFNQTTPCNSECGPPGCQCKPGTFAAA